MPKVEIAIGARRKTRDERSIHDERLVGRHDTTSGSTPAPGINDKRHRDQSGAVIIQLLQAQVGIDGYP
jgi:hypothetical protein